MKKRIEQKMKEFDFEAYNRKQIESGADLRLRKMVEKRVFLNYDIDLEKQIFGENAHEEFRKIKILKSAFEKAKYMSKRVVEIANENNIANTLEASFLSLANKDDDIIRDIYLSKSQKVSPITCELPGFGSIQSKNDIQKNTNYAIKGWCHSHGNIATFHSDTDKRTLKDLVSTLGFTKQINLSGNNENPFYRDVRYFPSLVVNSTCSQPHGAIGIQYKRLSDGQTYILNENVEVEIINDKKEFNIDKDVIDKEIFERVSVMNKGNLKELVMAKSKENAIQNESKDIENRIYNLENKYNYLEKRYSDVIDICDKFKQMYNGLKEKYS